MTARPPDSTGGGLQKRAATTGRRAPQPGVRARSTHAGSCLNLLRELEVQ